MTHWLDCWLSGDATWGRKTSVWCVAPGLLFWQARPLTGVHVTLEQQRWWVLLPHNPLRVCTYIHTLINSDDQSCYNPSLPSSTEGVYHLSQTSQVYLQAFQEASQGGSRPAPRSFCCLLLISSGLVAIWDSIVQAVPTLSLLASLVSSQVKYPSLLGSGHGSICSLLNSQTQGEA